jgi:hypothetical protein
MSGDEPWTFTAWGEDTLEHRQAKRALAEEREVRLDLNGVDPRLIAFVWWAASARLGALVHVDLREVSWLDDLVVEADDPGVPLLGLEFEERGVVARQGVLMERTPDLEVERDTSWVWEQVFGPGLVELARAVREGTEVDPALCDDDGRFERERLMFELWQLGGPALQAFAEGLFDGTVR